MMKRNLPPPPEDYKNEQLQIQARIEQLFEHSDDFIRKVPISNKGHWCDRLKHVRVDSLKGLPSEFVSYSTESKYHYLGNFEALYCLESSQLLIFHNGLPLSLAEAYQLLLIDSVQFRDYRLFQQLNRTGYICLRPSSELSPQLPLNQSQQSDSSPGSSSIELRSTEGLSSSQVDGPRLRASQGGDASLTDDVKPLFQIDSITLPLCDLMSRLQELGPLDYLPSKQSTKSNQLEMAAAAARKGSKDLNVTFDVYKRETFAKNKPRKGKQGNPDYFLIVCDKALQKQPSCNQLAQISNKLLFGLVDHDSSVCFAQWL